MRLHLVSRLVVVALGLTLLGVLLVVLRPGTGGAQASLRAASSSKSSYDVVSGSRFSSGVLSGTARQGHEIVIGKDGKNTTSGGKPVIAGVYVTPWVTPSTAFTQLIPSWRVQAGKGTWVVVEARVKAGSKTSSYDAVARWAKHEDQTKRATYSAQTDDLTKLNVDTLLSQAGNLTQWQIKVTMYRRPGSVSPVLSQVGAVATMPGGVPATSAPISKKAVTLDVPRYSQMIHRGEYPQYGGGGEAWCSPTSLAMIMGYYKRLPTAAQYSWVSTRYPDRWVAHTARSVYDWNYGGAGNWAFNTAFAGARVGDGFVTRMPSLREAEQMVRAGIPLAASIAFSRGQLSGAPISSSNGHLVVIVGFTASGDVVVNDPAAASNGTVRRTYQRAQFERVWQQKSLGTVYVVRPLDRPLPKASSPSW